MAHQFDRFEYLLSLVTFDMNRGDGDSDRGWAPVGRFAWRTEDGGRVVDEMIAEINHFGIRWPFIRDGLFRGSTERVAAAVEGVARVIGQRGRVAVFERDECRRGVEMTIDRIVGKGSEAPVERAFKAWLVADGWTLVNEAGSWADVIAERGDERLIGEVKGYTTSTGLDVDTMFGQLLRRMKPGAATTWAVIVPTRSLTAVLRVPIDCPTRPRHQGLRGSGRRHGPRALRLIRRRDRT